MDNTSFIEWSPITFPVVAANWVLKGSSTRTHRNSLHFYVKDARTSATKMRNALLSSNCDRRKRNWPVSKSMNPVYTVTETYPFASLSSISWRTKRWKPLSISRRLWQIWKGLYDRNECIVQNLSFGIYYKVKGAWYGRKERTMICKVFPIR